MKWLIVFSLPVFGFLWGAICYVVMNHILLIDGD